MKKILDLFTPNKTIGKRDISIMVSGQIILVLLFWCYSTTALIPKPLGILIAWKNMAMNGGLIQDLYISTKLCFHALLISVISSAVIAYLTVLPFFKPG